MDANNLAVGKRIWWKVPDNIPFEPQYGEGVVCGTAYDGGNGESSWHDFVALVLMDSGEFTTVPTK